MKFDEKDIQYLTLKDGARLAYYSFGSGQPFILLHGFPDTPKTFRHQVDTLVQAGYQVVCPYLPGYKFSDPPTNGHYFLLDITNMFEEMIETLFPGQDVVVYGHDYGSAFVQFMAALHSEENHANYNLTHVISGAVPPLRVFRANRRPLKQIYYSRYMIYFQFPFMIKRIVSKDLAFIKKLWLNWSPGTPADDPQVQDTLDVLRSGDSFRHAIHYYRYMLNPKYFNRVEHTYKEQFRLAKLSPNLPVLQLHGVKDGCVMSEMYKGCEDVYPHPKSKFVEMDNAGHFLHYDNPQDFNRLVLDYLKK